MANTIRLAAVFGAAALLLAACDDSDGGGGNAGAGTPQEEVGATFAQAFDADGTDAAADVEDGDAGDLSLTADPIDF